MRVMKRCQTYLTQISLSKSSRNQLSKIHLYLMLLPTQAKQVKINMRTLKFQISSLCSTRILTHHVKLKIKSRNGLLLLKGSQKEGGNVVPVQTTISKGERHARDATKILTLIMIPLEDQSIFSELMMRSKRNNRQKLRKEDKRRLKREQLRVSNTVISLAKSDQATGHVPNVITSTGPSEKHAIHVVSQSSKVRPFSLKLQCLNLWSTTSLFLSHFTLKIRCQWKICHNIK